MARDIGIDLGTANTIVHVSGKGIIIREPSVVAINKNTNQVLAVGDAAKRMIGRTPGSIVAIRPLKDGVIADFDITEQMLRHFIKKATGVIHSVDLPKAYHSATLLCRATKDTPQMFTPRRKHPSANVLHALHLIRHTI